MMDRCDITVSHCKLRCNKAVDGGALGIWGDCSPSFSQCEFAYNIADSANGSGGAILHQPVPTNGGYVTLDHCTIHHNTAAGGGAIWQGRSNFQLVNCTISENGSDPGWGGAAIVAWHSSGYQVSLQNCILWGNPASFYFGEAPGSVNATYSDIQGGYAGEGNIDADPLFVDSANGDFHLQEGSPCIDSGDPNSPLDPDYTRADIGAFYFPQPNLLVTPSSINFGLLDLGMDSMVIISLFNPTVNPVVIDTISHSIPDFIIDTTGLGGQVDSHETYYMTVTFIPSVAGTYIDTLIIVAEQTGDDPIRIPLSGEADVILPAVEGLVIQRGPLNGIQLRWQPVTHSIGGQPINADYIIYGTTSLDGPFIPFGYATDTSYVHPYILNIQSIYFYYVTAIPEGVFSASQIKELFGITVDQKAKQ